MTNVDSAPNPVLVQVWRGTAIESAHRGAVAVVDAAGRVLAALGDIERPIFPRSAVKLLQALPLVASGAADRLGLSDDELALACGSHAGEEPHVRTAAAMLAKAGVEAGVLECGVHWPYHDDSARALAARHERPQPLHNNCSGKHAGFVCLGCVLAGGRSRDELRGWLAGYVRPGHPVMREVSAALQAATGWDLAQSACGTDGCSIPTHAVPLRHLALAFARVATGHGLSDAHAAAAQRLRAAVARAPFMTGGSDRFDTRVMQAAAGRVYCKGGAEAVHVAALPELGVGVAIKVDDGTARASQAALAAVLLGLLPPRAGDPLHAVLQAAADATLRNWNGIEVGHVAALPLLRALGVGAP